MVPELPLAFLDRQAESVQRRPADVRVSPAEDVLRMRKTRIRLADDARVGQTEIEDVVRKRSVNQDSQFSLL